MDLQQLRAWAEELLETDAATVNVSDVADLLHEVQVYHVELELQNAELRRAQAEISTLQQRYMDLFMLAPVGYLVVDGDGRIADLNLVASELLQQERAYVRGRLLAGYLTTDAITRYQELLHGLHSIRSTQSVELAVRQRKTDTVAYVKVYAQSYIHEGNLMIRLTLTDITGRVEAEAAREESENRFRRAIVDAPEPIMVHAEDGEVILLSNQWTHLTGYIHEDIPTTADWARKAYGKQGAEVKTGIDALYEAATRHHEGDFTIRTREGRDIIWEFSSAPLGRMPDGRRLVMSVARDVTERRRIEAELAERTAFVDAVLNAAPGLVCTWEARTVAMRFINQKVRDLLGYEAETLLGWGPEVVTRLVHPDDVDGFRAHMARFRAPGLPEDAVVSNRCRLQDEAGAWHTFIFYNTVLTAQPDGTAAEIISAAVDVTELVGAQAAVEELNAALEERVEERTQALEHANQQLSAEIAYREQVEARLRDSEAFLQSVIDGQPAEIAVLDDNGMIIMVNRAWRQFAEANDAPPRVARGIGLDYLAALDTADDPEALEKLTQVLAGETQHLTHEYPCATPEEDLWFEMSIARFVRAGRPYVIVSHTDITARKQLEHEVQEALARERELNTLKSRFVSMISHEFRTPMSVMLTSASMLQDYHDRMDTEKRQQHLDKIIRQVHHLDTLLREVSRVNRHDVVDHTLRRHPVALVPLIRQISDDVCGTIQNGVEVTVAGAAEDETFSLDEALLHTILTNLLSNAVKYSPGGGPVEVLLARTPETVSISIRDNGIGIPEADQKFLFKEPFHRGANVGSISGTGMGHLIIKQAVDAHGGTISLDSTEDVGTTCTVTLPLDGDGEAG